MRKETKYLYLTGGHQAKTVTDATTGNTAVLQSLVDFLRYPDVKLCHRCHGRGVSYAYSACETCKGTGKESFPRGGR